MAFGGTPSLLTADNSAGGTSSTTASISPSANKLILALVEIYDSDETPPTVSLAGNGLTWVEVTGNSTTFSDNNDARLVLFRAMGAAPSAGAVTITHNDSTVDYCGWIIIEVDGVKISGANGADAVRQAVWAKGASTTLLSTLAAFGSVHNATFGFGSNDAGAAVTPGSGFAEITEVTGLMAEWKNTNDTTVDATITSNDWAMIGVELVARVAPPMFTKRPIRVWRRWG